jgi:hypothetical protein
MHTSFSFETLPGGEEFRDFNKHVEMVMEGNFSKYRTIWSRKPRIRP